MARWFDKIPKAVLDRGIERGLVAVGMLIEGQASLLAPWITGRLRGSITYATRDKGPAYTRYGPHKSGDAVDNPSSPYEVWIGTNVEYAPYIEYGTRRMGAKPYLRPALDKNRKNVSKLLMREIMTEYGRK